MRNSFKLTRSDDSAVLAQTDSIGTGAQRGHYGADAQMGADIMAHLRGEMPVLPLSIRDALEAGLTAMAMDEARTTLQVIDMTQTWAEFDAAMAGAT